MTATGQEPRSSLVRFDHIYDLYRNCILNELYYGDRLNLFTRSGLWLEVIVVVGSGTSGVAGWIIWTKYPALAALWAVVSAAATLLAALKPALRTDAKIKRYSSLFSAYRQLAVGMKAVVDEIAEAGGISREIERDISRVRTRYRALVAEDDPRPSPKLVGQLQTEVNRRVPPSSLFYPLPDRKPSPSTAQTPPSPTPINVAGDVEGADAKVDPIDPWPRGRGKSR
jgi:hypothetical protein